MCEIKWEHAISRYISTSFTDYASFQRVGVPSSVITNFFRFKNFCGIKAKRYDPSLFSDEGVVKEGMCWSPDPDRAYCSQVFRMGR